ncbi:MAG: universal stress protein [Deltaproteobacteria bacterium]|nr:universal stress protein [Deltaproteobacteria bacterium]
MLAFGLNGIILILPTKTPKVKIARHKEWWQQLAREESRGDAHVHVVRSDNVAAEIIAEAVSADLILLGLNQVPNRRRVFGDVVTQVIAHTKAAVMIIGQRD